MTTETNTEPDTESGTEPGADLTAAVYRDSTAAVDDRVRDLLARMTFAEKVAQLGSAWVFDLTVSPTAGSPTAGSPTAGSPTSGLLAAAPAADGGTAGGAQLDAERAAATLEHGIGQITRISGASFLGAGAAAALANDIQRFLADHTRLGIPAIVHEEICSGLMAREATTFPQAIGVASTWEPALNERLATEVRGQMRAIGARQGLSPVLDVTRDPRWGRTEETYGEDPQLVSEMGVAFVRGLQGDGRASGVVATAKHFVGYGLSEGGLNWAPVRVGERELRDVYLRPFEAAVKVAGLASVMNGYHELDGVPCAANDALFELVLRRDWAFDGIVVSDYFAVRHLDSVHHVAPDGAGAATAALTTGIDVELPRTDCYDAAVVTEALANGLDQAAVDRCVERVLRLKFELGLFDSPYVDVDEVAAVTRTAEQRALAHEIAVKSQVLLKNDGVLPLISEVGTIAVVGPNADRARHMLGDYAYPAHAESLRDLLDSARADDPPAGTGGAATDSPGDDPDDDGVLDFEQPEHVGTVLDSLRRHRTIDAEILHAPGCGVTGDDRSGFADAVAAAEAADVVIAVVGDRSGLTVESTSGESRDAASLALPGVQEELVAAVAATGTPVIVVLVTGRPCGSPALHEVAAAVLLSWLPGEAGADAIVEVLAGDADPGGRLPITYPRSSGQVPVYYGHKPSGGRSNWKGDYVDLPVAPLYPFGFGLGYTTFEIDVVSPAAGGSRCIDESASVTVGVTNTGDRAGDHVVQLYAHRGVASVTRPVRELVAFARVTAAAGERREVTFDVPIAQLGFSGRDLRYVVEAGTIELFVGSSAADVQAAGSIDLLGGHPERAFSSTVTVR